MKFKKRKKERYTQHRIMSPERRWFDNIIPKPKAVLTTGVLASNTALPVLLSEWPQPSMQIKQTYKKRKRSEKKVRWRWGRGGGRGVEGGTKKNIQKR
jgi:hypothetical protein